MASSLSPIFSVDQLSCYGFGACHQVSTSLWNTASPGLRRTTYHAKLPVQRHAFRPSTFDVTRRLPPVLGFASFRHTHGAQCIAANASASSEREGGGCSNVAPEHAKAVEASLRLTWTNASKLLEASRCPSSAVLSLRERESGLHGGRENVEEGRDNSWFSMLSHDKHRTVMASMVAAAAAVLVLGIPSAHAADALKTCACLLKNCKVELARCIGDPKCAANIACLQTCNDRPDETECQIKCGDLFADTVVDDFNKCAITEGNCVPQKTDEGRYPVPPPEALVTQFDARVFNGKWYISSGLNPTFDTFDCQLHEFMSSSPDKMMAVINWRINTPDGGFFTRQALQKFVRDPQQEGLLLNHDNEFLHYQDDWYILAAQTEGKPDDFIFVYYKGSNDAWDGYGGAVVYTRSPTLPRSIRPQLEAASKSVGLKFSDFRETDNSCPPPRPLIARLEKKAEDALLAGEQAIVQSEQNLVQKVTMIAKKEAELLKSLGKGIGKEVVRDEEIFLAELAQEERDLFKKLQGMGMDAADIEDLLGNPVPIRRLRSVAR